MLGIRSDRFTVRCWVLASFLFASSAFGQVGMTQIRAGDGPITLVYPTAAESSLRQLGPFALQVAMNAAPSGGNGRLVVFSHGTGGDALTLHTLARTLALAGFVVAQPEHRGDNWQDQGDAGPTSWQRRPGEMSRAIDAVASDPRFNRFLRFDRVGIYGVSAGGVTGLALAGGDWSIATLKRHCAVHVRDDAGFCLYGVRSAAEGTARANSYTTPIEASADEPLAGARVKDPRVAAVALSVPVGAIFTPESLAAIRIPVGIVEAQSDLVLNPVYHSGYVLEHCNSCQRIDSVSGSGHFDTLSPWPAAIAVAAAQAPGGQRNPAIDDVRRQQSYDLITRFFADELLTK
ncbi:MAG: dienelactone hydrolase [Bacteroidetes bacterium]|nr:dienelactone hydrolase [Bacteroidota bacterium]